MKISPFTYFLSALALADIVVVTTAVAVAKSPREYEQEFTAWLARHDLAFADPLEYVRRMETYVANDMFIHTHNMKANTTSSFTLDHNAFSHLTFDEFAQRSKGFVMPPGYLEARLAAANATQPLGSSAVSDSDSSPLPASVDWVAKGAVTPVKNQGQCGSCWAFSTTGAVEGAAFVASGKLPNLSEQELVDCDHNGDHGCNGGLMDHAFEWIHAHGGICAESEYAYHGALEQCHMCKQIVAVAGFTDVAPNNEDALRAAVAQQPVAVAIEADQREFQFYKSGVFDLTCGTQLDHGVLVVGYGQDADAGRDAKKFWNVKNSWGPTWGERGYIRLARDLGPAAGQCGIAMVPSYPHASWTSTGASAAMETAATAAVDISSEQAIAPCEHEMNDAQAEREATLLEHVIDELMVVLDAERLIESAHVDNDDQNDANDDDDDGQRPKVYDDLSYAAFPGRFP